MPKYNPDEICPENAIRMILAAGPESDKKAQMLDLYEKRRRLQEVVGDIQEITRMLKQTPKSQ